MCFYLPILKRFFFLCRPSVHAWPLRAPAPGAPGGPLCLHGGSPKNETKQKEGDRKGRRETEKRKHKKLTRKGHLHYVQHVETQRTSLLTLPCDAAKTGNEK